MSNLTDLLPAGAGGKQVSFVASGTIGNGVTVALNSDGTVTAVSGVTEGVGSPAIFESANTLSCSCAFDSSNNKVVIFYLDLANSDYGTAIVGTVSGTNISFGTPVVFESSAIYITSTVFDINSNKTVTTYRASSTGRSIVGTVSGTSISFGSFSYLSTNSVYSFTSTFDSANNKVVVAYTDLSASNYGKIKVGTVSGTSISYGTEVTYNSARSEFSSLTFDSLNNKIVLSFTDHGNSEYGTSIVGTVSGTSISFGAKTAFESGRTEVISSAFDSLANKIVIAYQDVLNSRYGTGIVGTVSGTSISFGTPVVFNAARTDDIAIAFDTSSSKCTIAYQDEGNSNYGTLVVGSVSGDSISFGSELVFENAIADEIAITFDSNANKIVIAYQDEGNAGYGTSVVFQNASSNSTSFIGISDAAISDTASGSVTIKGGISTNFTGLTANLTYYVQDNGTLSTTTSSVLAGKALSSTSINLDYTT